MIWLNSSVLLKIIFLFKLMDNYFIGIKYLNLKIYTFILYQYIFFFKKKRIVEPRYA